MKIEGNVAVPRRRNGRLRKMTREERSVRAARNLRRDRRGRLAEKSAERAGLIVAKDLRELRRQS